MLSQFQVLPGSMGDWRVKGGTAKAATRSNPRICHRRCDKEGKPRQMETREEWGAQVSWPGWDFEWSEC